MTVKDFIKKWGTVITVATMATTTAGIISQPVTRYKEYRAKQDSIAIAEDKIRIHKEVEGYIEGFTSKVEHLDSLDTQLMKKLDAQQKKDSLSKAVGIRAYTDGRFEVRDEWLQIHEAFRYTITRQDGSIEVWFKYIERTTGIQYNVFWKSYRR